MRLRLVATLAGAVALPTVLSAQESRPRVELGVLGRTSLETPALDLDDAMGGGLRIGILPFRSLQRLRLEGEVTRSKQDQSQLSPAPILGATRNDWVGRALYEQPLVSRVHGLVGLGYKYSDADRAIFAGRSSFHAAQGLLGLRLGLSEMVSLRMEGTYGLSRLQDARQDSVPTPPAPQMFGNWGLQAGLSIGFGGRKKVVKEVAPVEMPAPPAAVVPVLPEVPVVSEPEPIAASEPMRVTLNTIHFAYDRATLTAEARRKIRETGDMLKTHQQMIVDIVGHTDSKGTVNYNQKLSERRAIAVRDYMLTLGIGVTRMTVKGMGDREPIADNATAEGRARNRRVEVVGEKHN